MNLRQLLGQELDASPTAVVLQRVPLGLGLHFLKGLDSHFVHLLPAAHFRLASAVALVGRGGDGPPALAGVLLQARDDRVDRGADRPVLDDRGRFVHTERLGLEQRLGAHFRSAHRARVPLLAGDPLAPDLRRRVPDQGGVRLGLEQPRVQPVERLQPDLRLGVGLGRCGLANDLEVFGGGGVGGVVLLILGLHGVLPFCGVAASASPVRQFPADARIRRRRRRPSDALFHVHSIAHTARMDDAIPQEICETRQSKKRSDYAHLRANHALRSRSRCVVSLHARGVDLTYFL